MNVIIANKYKDMLMSLNIEVIKSMEGVFEIDEIIDTFSNFYFERMILDITAIKNYKELDNLQKLSINLDMNKIILVLDDSQDSESGAYLSKLISMGIYNFTRNIEGINYLIANPHTYRDVAHIHNVDNVTDNSTVAHGSNRVRIIGIKNLTEHAGATTLTYLLKKHLQSNYSVAAIEVEKKDFLYFQDEELISTSNEDLAKELMKKSDYDILLVDLNNYPDDTICSDVLYLIEPSLVKLNKLVKRDRKVFDKMDNKKVVLNQSFIQGSDLAVFEYESKIKIYYNIPPIDDRKIPHNEINGLLSKMGLISQTSSDANSEDFKNKLLGLFKF